MLLKITILTILIHSIHPLCASQCSTCSIDSNPYACTSCSSSTANQYITSCQTAHYDLSTYIAITVVVVLIHCFSLAMGIGIYRQIYENIQLVSLTTWRYGFEGSTIAFQGTNFAIVKSNSFIDNFGVQFLVLVAILCFFWLVFLIVEKNAHDSTAILIRRKKIIFPVRLQTLIFNVLFFTSLVQVTTINTSSYNYFSFALAIFGLVGTVAILIGLAIVSNWKRFQVDDPHYYVLLEQITSKKWYAKNNVLLSLLTRGLIIIVFVMMFRTPQASGIIMTIVQVCYSIYIMTFIRYTKIRYFIIIIVGNLLVVGIFIVRFIGGISDVGTASWQQSSTSYVMQLIMLVAFFFFVTLLELILKRDIVTKQLKSIYNRFIKCERLEDKVIASKYDDNSHRERVTEFKTNLLYHKELGDPQIELSDMR